MTDATAQVFTIQDAHDAKLAQIATVIAGLESLSTAIADMEAASLGGVSLWTGGLPESLTQVKQQIDFQVIRLREKFPSLPA